MIGQPPVQGFVRLGAGLATGLDVAMNSGHPHKGVKIGDGASGR